MSPSLILYIPMTLLVGGLVVTICGTINRRLAYPVFWVFLAGSTIAALLGLQQVLRFGTLRYELGGWAPPIGIEYVLDPLSAFMAALITCVAVLVMIYAKKSAGDELPGRDTSFYGMSALLLAGLLGIVVTGDLFNLYVFLEIASLAAYALLATGEKRAPLAAFRYVLLGTVSASFYLIGIGLLYSRTGTLNMADMAAQMGGITSFRSVQLAAVFLVTAMGIKMALFPLHLWLPDAYTYAPSTVTGLIAPLMTKVGAYAMIRLLLFVLGPAFIRDDLGATAWIAWVSAAGILAGSIMAIAQKDLKRMLAYSSVSQVAYIGLGIGLGNVFGFIGAVLHILNHALMKACLFLVAGIIRYKHGAISIPQFAGLGRRMPLTMAAFTIAALSMVGLPPAAGFFSKWYLVLGGIESRQWIFVAVILVSSLLNAVYFFNVLEKIYLTRKDDGQEDQAGWDEAPVSMLIPTLILAVGILAAGLANAVIVEGILRKALPPGI
ncbi:MAG: monovalent cation/H+ antiporter subunit D family protein [Candidatus Eisenbacteria bacterium]|uniref:Monovalent cation/H+ antiporter subunit D family protein n=1 Tax=Eiseniibacteriota bacterium TaxID=2212470 RepID=A0A948RVP9_UNCEI|nr:monovalent cation/H+ antiporter subunit D family protein [Candidatus Eisenbacteria bacterium]MBU1947466.1 monovalent cation/H+ antiporter subunit D family protein [Candidatus Eisenbacteria bacterium]MBU2690841.1 monovalent cation/H+ antiporter subunit D family protein [Candidatus Eisenbacteria bacterium]